MTYRRPLQACLIALGILALPAAAFAAGQAKVLAQGADKSATMTIEYDAGQARLQTDHNPDSYFLVREGNAYAIAEDEGQTKVFDLHQVAELGKSRRGGEGGGFGGRFGRGERAAQLDVAEVKSMIRTDETETIAGIEGNVYTIEYLDKQGETRTTDAVLSKDRRAHEFTQAMYRIGTSLREGMGTPGAAARFSGAVALWQQIDAEDLGLLRFGEYLRVVELDDKAPEQSRFELPAEVTPITGLRDLVQLRVLRPD